MHNRFIPTRVGNSHRLLRRPGQSPVHPHAGGEQAAHYNESFSVSGSSPRGWGTGRGRQIAIVYPRFIPTRVGNRFLIRFFRANLAVHPHAGGEQIIGHNVTFDKSGSSPRGWGTVQTCYHRFDLRRFIPTRVGNSTSNAPASLTNSVHPHAGGEQHLKRARQLDKFGSSPRGWGTVFCPAGGRAKLRFIPTRVGNRMDISINPAAIPVHPHAGGEQSFSRNALLSKNGSSPRGWGTDTQFSYSQAGQRFIPTRVGNSLPRFLHRLHSAVHPHAGGEQAILILIPKLLFGSSPRGWGTEKLSKGRAIRPRFIPTRVGNRLCAAMRQFPAAVHPHAGGEQA